MSRWLKNPKNQGESSGSSGRRRAPPLSSSTPLPPPPPPAAFGIAPDGVRVLLPTRRAGAADPAPRDKKKKKRMRRYVRVEECWWHWNNATHVDWPDVHLSDD